MQLSLGRACDRSTPVPRKFLFLVVALLFIASTACDRPATKKADSQKAESTPSSSSPKQSASAPRDSQKEHRGLGWKVSKGDKYLYLVGSVHVGTPDLYPLPTPIDRAFEESRILVQEIDVFEAKQPEKLAFMTKAAAYEPGDQLNRHISPEVVALYEKSPVSSLFGPAGQNLRPWFLSIAITMQALETRGYVAALGLDQHFADRAEKKGMKYEAIETVEGQLKALSDLPDKTQELMLKDTLLHLPDLPGDIDKTLDAWKSGDEKAVERIMMESMRQAEYRPVYESLFLRRNKEMQKAILRYLETPAIEFIVLGSGHLVGQDGLVTTLSGEGRQLERL